MNFRILYRDEHLVAVEKPAGFQVHPHENPAYPLPDSANCLRILRKQLECYLYPVHRIDRATSGVLLFALNPEMARAMGELFRTRAIQKTYYCVARGWTAPSGSIDYALPLDEGRDDRGEAVTDFRILGQTELQTPIGRYATARYSLVRAFPRTGRLHQIRRHFAHVSHQLIGDTVYGDGKHNRFFREKLGIEGLLLKAYSLEFRHPVTGETLKIPSRWNGRWHRVFDIFGVCPISE